ncbi:glycosyltransferase family 9 protein [Propionivibrio dicarboxylicus]|uniref:ADP-heptose:LPS heptosyltransferase n=1 Tax=Propionivibrio dicarboxylicus TaxID=83767 RepID=A0A1G8L0V2_9RHOO|nr:glycosyltransferase family 9 protein [Propionivibrio dicarboxylicus]SDI49365.1 ADP-heptose:LPS heptosyltransferase [Propionivibrio dicarboxylicus]
MKILVIRRDNIGDLVCTTPLISALRRHWPGARIETLVNSYNAPVLAGNPDLDAVHAYRKAKHRNAGESQIAIWMETLGLILRLRRTRFDLIVVATPGPQPGAVKFARWIGAKTILAHSAADNDTGHESERVMRLLHPLGIDTTPGPLTLHADPALAHAVTLPPAPIANAPIIGLHISARKPSQRWPIERFADLAHALHQRDGSRFLLFWSPGNDDHPQHPGDDRKAAKLIEACVDLPFTACPTHHLEDLIAGLSRCDRVICSDGGAMHVAAGLGKPIVCFFGNSGPERWHPWGVPYEVLQPASLDVADISVDDALAACLRLELRLASDQARR